VMEIVLTFPVGPESHINCINRPCEYLSRIRIAILGP